MEIIEYNKQKVLREERKAKEAAILREEKQGELKKLLEMQEKANDKAAELDEIRAR